MIEALKFVQGAIGKKDLIPELTHFRILNGNITGYNGRITLNSPIDCDIDCCPKAEPFIRAIRACEDTAQLHLTETKRLAIRSGKFRTHIETLDEAFTGVDPTGMLLELDGHLLPILRKLYEITSEDASRPWAGGVLFNGHSAFATNNVMLVEMWLGYFFPFQINVPRFAIKELLRINEEPTYMRLDANSATFFYDGGRWLRTLLLSPQWPDVAKILGDPLPAKKAIDDSFFETLDKIQPFVSESSKVYFLENMLSTHPDTSDGTAIECRGVEAGPIFNIEMLQLLNGVAKTIDFSQYPAPCPFYGHNLRGIIVGVRS